MEVPVVSERRRRKCERFFVKLDLVSGEVFSHTVVTSYGRLPVRLLSRWPAAVLVLALSIALVGCDTLPSRSKIGAMASERGVVTVLWGNCPGEHVERVELRLTDKKHSRTERLVWAIEADAAASTTTSFIAGRTPAGYHEVVPYVDTLEGGDPVSAVVTSTKVDQEFLDFTMSELKRDEVLVNRSPRHVSQRTFSERVQKLCKG